MKSIKTQLPLLLITLLLSGCYTELALIKPETRYDATSTADRYNNRGTPSERTYTTNPNATEESDELISDGVFVNYEDVPFDAYLGNQLVRTDEEERPEMREYLRDNSDLGCDPLFYDRWNCTTDILFAPNFSFNRFGHYNQWSRFGIGSIGLGFNAFYYDPFWFGPSWGNSLFWNDPWFSPFGWNSWAYNWNVWNPWNPWNGFNRNWGNGVFIAYNGNLNVNTSSRTERTRGSSVGRMYNRSDRNMRANQSKSATDEILRSARTTSYSPVNTLRSSYTSNRRSARTPSNSRLSGTTYSNRSPRSLSSSSTRRSFRGASTSRYNSQYSRPSNSTRTQQSRSYRNAARSTQRSYGRSSSSNSSRSTPSRSSSVSRGSSSSRSSSPAKSSSSSRSTTRSKRGNN